MEEKGKQQKAGLWMFGEDRGGMGFTRGGEGEGIETSKQNFVAERSNLEKGGGHAEGA